MNPQGHQTGRGGHEGKDADVINLAMIASLLLLVIIMCLLVCWGILHAFNREQTSKELPRVRMVEQAARFPQPQLLTEPGKEWRQTRLAAETRLRTYGWVDREAGVAHIPITAAMKLLLQRGLPEVGGGQTRLQLMQSRPQTNPQPNGPIASPVPKATP
jgi:hypothetical protein